MYLVRIDVFNGSYTSDNHGLNIFKLSANPLLFIQRIRSLFNFVSCSLTSKIFLPVMIMLASSANSMNLGIVGMFGRSVTLISKSRNPIILRNMSCRNRSRIDSYTEKCLLLEILRSYGALFFSHILEKNWEIGRLGMANIRPTYGQYTANIRPTYGQHTANIRPLHGKHTANIRPTYGQHTANMRPTCGQHTANIRPTYGQHTANIRPTYG